MKKIGANIYVHKSNGDKLSENIRLAIRLIEMKHIPSGFNFEIIKINTNKNTISFIQSNNWNYAREPEVGDAYVFNLEEQKGKIIKSKGQIYHHKWMFVSDDYKGFDVNAAKAWSETWTSKIPNKREVKCRIGYKKYWDEILSEYNLEVE